MLKERIESYVNDLHTHDLIALWNSYCEEVCCCSDMIYSMDELDDYFCYAKALEILNRVGKDFNTNHDYFKDGVYGLESFDFARREIDTDTLVEYIIEWCFSGDDDELKEILDEYDDEIDAP